MDVEKIRGDALRIREHYPSHHLAAHAIVKDMLALLDEREKLFDTAIRNGMADGQPYKILEEKHTELLALAKAVVDESEILSFGYTSVGKPAKYSVTGNTRNALAKHLDTKE